MKQVIWALSFQATGPRGCDLWAHIQPMGMTQRIGHYWSNRASKQTAGRGSQRAQGGLCRLPGEGWAWDSSPGWASTDRRSNSGQSITGDHESFSIKSKGEEKMEQKEKASNQSCCKRNGEMHTCPSRSREAKPTYWTEYWIKTESPE